MRRPDQSKAAESQITARLRPTNLEAALALTPGSVSRVANPSCGLLFVRLTPALLGLP